MAEGFHSKNVAMYAGQDYISLDGRIPRYQVNAYFGQENKFVRKTFTGEEIIDHTFEIPSQPFAEPLVLSATGEPEFTTNHAIQHGDSFYEDGSYRYIPDGGHTLVSRKQELITNPDTNLVLVPNIFDDNSKDILQVVLASYDAFDSDRYLKMLYSLAQCSVPSDPEGQLTLYRGGTQLLTISDGKAIPNMQLTPRENNHWNTYYEYRIEKRTDRYRFESTSSIFFPADLADEVVAAEEYGDEYPDGVYFVLSGLDFSTNDSTTLINLVQCHIEGDSVDEDAIREIVRPYIRLVEAG